jgi:hypothetical protein
VAKEERFNSEECRKISGSASSYRGNNKFVNWAAKIEIYLIGVSLKSIQSHSLRTGKSGISIGDIPSIFG